MHNDELMVNKDKEFFDSNFQQLVKTIFFSIKRKNASTNSINKFEKMNTVTPALKSSKCFNVLSEYNMDVSVNSPFIFRSFKQMLPRSDPKMLSS